MQPFELDPMAMMQAQADRIMALTNENVRLTAAVVQLQKQVALNNGQVEDVTDEDSPFARDYKAEAQDVTDEVVRAEITT